MRIGIGATANIDFETAGGAQAADRRRVDGEGDAVREHEALAADLLHQLQGGLMAILPRFQGHEDGGGIALIAAADQVKTVDDKYVLDGLIAVHHVP